MQFHLNSSQMARRDFLKGLTVISSAMVLPLAGSNTANAQYQSRQQWLQNIVSTISQATRSDLSLRAKYDLLEALMLQHLHGSSFFQLATGGMQFPRMSPRQFREIYPRLAKYYALKLHEILTWDHYQDVEFHSIAQGRNENHQIVTGLIQRRKPIRMELGIVPNVDGSFKLDSYSLLIDHWDVTRQARAPLRIDLRTATHNWSAGLRRLDSIIQRRVSSFGN